MAASSTSNKIGDKSGGQYGTAAVVLHWVSALLIVFVLVSGFKADDAADAVSKTAILQKHVPAAIAVLVLTVIRLVWWWKFDTKPAAIGAPGSLSSWGAKAVHVAFYVVIIGMVASGIGMMIASGAMPIIFAGDAARLPDFTDFAPRIPHGIGARLFVALLVAHIGAALYHHFVLRDRVLRRMWFRRKGA